MHISRLQLTEEIIMLISAWLVYALCQNDITFPLIALAAVLPSYLYLMFKRHPRQISFDPSWRILAAIAIGAGLVWRTILPQPEGAFAFIPVVLPSLQTAAVVGSVFVWYRVKFPWRSNGLKLLSWLIVGMSMDIKFNAAQNTAFWLFCLINIGFLLINVYRVPAGDKKGMTEKNPALMIYPLLLGSISIIVFAGLIQGIRLGDDVFMRLVQDYLNRQRFELFDPVLKLNGSAANNVYAVKPVLEVDRSGQSARYLAAQVFEDYADGSWKSLNPGVKALPADELDSGGVQLDMYEYLQDIIPAPRGVIAYRSKWGALEKDINGIVFNTKKTIPQVTLFFNKGREVTQLSDDTYQRLSYVQDSLAQQLAVRTAPIVGDTKEPIKTARQIENYFHDNFKYSLDPRFTANDRGLLLMLDQKRPAYCSYFASAMSLMLRERKIPARVVAGFMATEISGWNKDKFMVRGRDAHAWVEVFVPALDRQTHQPVRGADGQHVGLWVSFDPTPGADGAVSNQINRLADFIWCTQKRLKAVLLNMETKTLIRILVIIIAIVALEEIGKILYKRLRSQRKLRDDWKRGMNTPQENPCLSYYKVLEKFLKEKLKIKRSEAETDAELLQRLRERRDIKLTLVAQIETFLLKYQAARFGGRPAAELEGALQKIRK